jgi:hypothetical protein
VMEQGSLGVLQRYWTRIECSVCGNKTILQVGQMFSCKACRAIGFTGHLRTPRTRLRSFRLSG